MRSDGLNALGQKVDLGALCQCPRCERRSNHTIRHPATHCHTLLLVLRRRLLLLLRRLRLRRLLLVAYCLWLAACCLLRLLMLLDCLLLLLLVQQRTVVVHVEIYPIADSLLDHIAALVFVARYAWPRQRQYGDSCRSRGIYIALPQSRCEAAERLQIWNGRSGKKARLSLQCCYLREVRHCFRVAVPAWAGSAIHQAPDRDL